MRSNTTYFQIPSSRFRTQTLGKEFSFPQSNNEPKIIHKVQIYVHDKPFHILVNFPWCFVFLSALQRHHFVYDVFLTYQTPKKGSTQTYGQEGCFKSEIETEKKKKEKRDNLWTNPMPFVKFLIRNFASFVSN